MSKNRLQSLLRMSIIIFIILEMIIIIISTKITSWIIKPVIETFNKQKTIHNRRITRTKKHQ